MKWMSKHLFYVKLLHGHHGHAMCIKLENNFPLNLLYNLKCNVFLNLTDYRGVRNATSF